MLDQNAPHRDRPSYIPEERIAGELERIGGVANLARAALIWDRLGEEDNARRCRSRIAADQAAREARRVRA
ncbi:MAG: hypothetical protein K2X74_00650 [Acetobacteraceae bacterium]|nr:hypothetical protein [Acetobacteraceae bacterium]